MNLQRVKLRVLRQRRLESLDLHRWATGQIADQYRSVADRHADAAHAGIQADVNRDRLTQLRSNPVEHIADRRVYHRRDVARDCFLEI